jgi:hypothetical protein
LADADKISVKVTEQLNFIIRHQLNVKKGNNPIYYIHCEKHPTVNHQMQSNLFDDKSRPETVSLYTKIPSRRYEVQLKLATHFAVDLALCTKEERQIKNTVTMGITVMENCLV